jgi:hypothetical protein
MSWLTETTKFQQTPGSRLKKWTANSTQLRLTFTGLRASLEATVPVPGERWSVDGVNLTVVEADVTENAKYPDVGTGEVLLVSEASIRTERYYLGKQLQISDLPMFDGLTDGEKEYVFISVQEQTQVPLGSVLQRQMYDWYASKKVGRAGASLGQRRTTVVAASDVAFIQDGRFIVENPPLPVRVPSGTYFVKSPVNVTAEGGRTTKIEEWLSYREKETPVAMWQDTSSTSVVGG